MKHSVSFVIKNLIFVTHFYCFIYTVYMNLYTLQSTYQSHCNKMITNTNMYTVRSVLYYASAVLRINTPTQDIRMFYETFHRFLLYWFLFVLSFVFFYSTNTIKWYKMIDVLFSYIYTNFNCIPHTKCFIVFFLLLTTLSVFKCNKI